MLYFTLFKHRLSIFAFLRRLKNPYTTGKISRDMIESAFLLLREKGSFQFLSESTI